jgi:ribonuclease D
MPYDLQLDLTEEQLGRMRQGGAVGVDTETTGLNPLRDLLALVQVCDSDGNVAILRRRDWQNAEKLRELLTDRNVQKVFHYAPFDCGFFSRYMNLEVANVFCTMIASRFARTYTPEHGYDELVLELFGEKVVDPQGTTDWYTGDISREQLEYAAKDVVWLIPLRDKLLQMMESKGILPSGISYLELNARAMEFIPTLVQLRLNGWDIGQNLTGSVFYYH